MRSYLKIANPHGQTKNDLLVTCCPINGWNEQITEFYAQGQL